MGENDNYPWIVRPGLAPLASLPKGERFTGLERRDGTIYATSTCGTFKIVKGRLVLSTGAKG